MSESRALLNLLHKTLLELGEESDHPSHKAKLSAGGVLLNELMLLTDTDFYRQHVMAGLKLLEEGRQLTPDAATLEDAPGALAEEDVGIEAIFERREHLSGLLAAQVALLDPSTPEVRDFLARVGDWDGAFYAHSLQQAAMPSTEKSDPFTREAVEAYLRAKLADAPQLRITGFTPLMGGFSKRTILIDLDGESGGPRSIVLRAEQPCTLLRFSNVVDEFQTISYLHAYGLPVPEGLWLEEDTSYFGLPFLLSAKAPGTNYGVTMGGRDEVSPELLQSVIDNLSALHNVVPDPADPRVASGPLGEWQIFSTTAAATEHYVGHYLPRLVRDCRITPTPLLARAMHWLKANVPPGDARPVVLHLDFGLNNVLINGEQVSAILDLESIVMGNPALDIITTQEALGKFISMPDFLERYRERTGRTISEYDIAYAQVARSALYLIIFLHARRLLLNEKAAPIMLSLLGFPYLGGVASQLGGVLANGEKARAAMTGDPEASLLAGE